MVYFFTLCVRLFKKEEHQLLVSFRKFISRKHNWNPLGFEIRAEKFSLYYTAVIKISLHIQCMNMKHENLIFRPHPAWSWLMLEEVEWETVENTRSAQHVKSIYRRYFVTFPPYWIQNSCCIVRESYKLSLVLTQSWSFAVSRWQHRPWLNLRVTVWLTWCYLLFLNQLNELLLSSNFTLGTMCHNI